MFSLSLSPQARDTRELGSFSPGGLCCLVPREERTGLAWNCGLAWWARWWGAVLGEAGVAEMRGWCFRPLLACGIHILRLGVVGREKG